MDGKRLINKELYDRVEAKVKALPRPTIGDGIDAMCDEGNGDYIREWPHIDHPYALDETFYPDCDRHDIVHLCARIPHTPEHEYETVAFDIGMMGFAPHEVKQLPQMIKDVLKSYNSTTWEVYFKNPEEHPIPQPSKRNTAIYLAAGMYLRQRFEALNEAGLAGADYDAQLAFLDHYTNKPYTPHSFVGKNIPLNYARLPYGFCQLSPKEWRAITAVATGLRTPERTGIYAERLAPIKAVLEESGLAYNLLNKKPLTPLRSQTLVERWRHPQDMGR